MYCTDENGVMPKLGRVYKAPETFRGSLRYYQRKYADIMAVTNKFGKPHLMITFTVNEKCPDLQHMLKPGQIAADRPDLTMRLFIDKVNELIKDINDREVLGPVLTWNMSMEHQKA